MAEPQMLSYNDKKPPSAEFDEALYKRLKNWFRAQNTYLKGGALTILAILLVSPFFVNANNTQNVTNKAAEPSPSIILPPTDTPMPTDTPYLTPTSASINVAGPGQHCGGNIQSAKQCIAGYHCLLNRIADTGGICVSNTTQ